MSTARTPPSHPAFAAGLPVEVGHCFLLVPGETLLCEAPTVTGDRIPILLSRGRAFGSGLHETTLSCMETLEGLVSLENRSVLDVGTGTGILSLAAIFLGARSAVAFDIESDAARTCNRNATLNRVEEQLRVFNGTLEALNPSVGFDLVLANIHGDIILKEAHRLTGHTREGGLLLLSGIDYTDSRAVKLAMEREGLVELSVSFLEDYVTQVWHRLPKAGEKEP